MFGNDSIEMKEEYDVVTLSGGFVPGHVPMFAYVARLRYNLNFSNCLCSLAGSPGLSL